MVKLTPLFGLPILDCVVLCLRWREEIRSGTVADQGELSPVSLKKLRRGEMGWSTTKRAANTQRNRVAVVFVLRGPVRAGTKPITGGSMPLLS